MISAELASRLHACLGGIVNELECIPHKVNGMDDHIHMLISLNPKVGVSELMRVAKANSSKWVHGLGGAHSRFAW